MRFRPCYSFVRLIFIESWYAGKNQTGISDPLKSGVTTVRGNINFSSERRTSANHTLSDRRKRMDCESIETRSPAESTLKWKHQTVAEIYNRGEKSCRYQRNLLYHLKLLLSNICAISFEKWSMIIELIVTFFRIMINYDCI